MRWSAPRRTAKRRFAQFRVCVCAESRLFGSSSAGISFFLFSFFDWFSKPLLLFIDRGKRFRVFMSFSEGDDSSHSAIPSPSNNALFLPFFFFNRNGVTWNLFSTLPLFFFLSREPLALLIYATLDLKHRTVQKLRVKLALYTQIKKKKKRASVICYLCVLYKPFILCLLFVFFFGLHHYVSLAKKKKSNILIIREPGKSQLEVPIHLFSFRYNYYNFYLLCYLFTPCFNEAFLCVFLFCFVSFFISIFHCDLLFFVVVVVQDLRGTLLEGVPITFFFLVLLVL